MKFIYDDGGRKNAGYKGSAGDCVARSIAIAAQMPYEEIYQRLSSGAGNERKAKGKTARNGIHVKRKWFKDFMRTLGFEWVPTMGIGTGCKVHLTDGELPMGRLVVSVSKHYTAVIDGVIRDTFSPERNAHVMTVKDGVTTHSVQKRCVYGYWKLSEA
jgi:hypothetical protein